MSGWVMVVVVVVVVACRTKHPWSLGEVSVAHPAKQKGPGNREQDKAMQGVHQQESALRVSLGRGKGIQDRGHIGQKQC